MGPSFWSEISQRMNFNFETPSAKKYGFRDTILIRLNCPEYFIGFRFNWKHGFFNDILHHVVMDKQTKLVPLTTLHDSRVVESARR